MRPVQSAQQSRLAAVGASILSSSQGQPQLHFARTSTSRPSPASVAHLHIGRSCRGRQRGQHVLQLVAARRC